MSTLPDAEAWVAFTCRDEQHTGNGDSFGECLAALEDVGNITAVGVNCVSPAMVCRDPHRHSLRINP